MHHHHNHWLVGLSICIAIFSSYIALDLAGSLSGSQGKSRWAWLTGGSLAMGIGIWSMHFIGMLAFSMPGITISYDVPLLILSIFVAVIASALALFLVSRQTISTQKYIWGSLTMGAGIAGMHYIGIASMRMAAIVTWNSFFVIASLLNAVGASFVAIIVAFKLKSNVTKASFIYKASGAAVLGLAIAGMHYTAMAAMSFTATEKIVIQQDQILATDGLALSVIIATVIILCISLTGSVVDRELSRRMQMNNALKDAIQTRDEFLSIASHELKTPLTSLKLQNQLISRKADKISNLASEDRDKIQNMVDKMDTSIERLTRLVDDMLDISRISTGKMNLQVEKFDLAELTKDIVERLEPVLLESNCEVKFVQLEKSEGRWDKFRVEQVITNLLTNAARYGSNCPIEIQVTKNNSSVDISIKDFGRGIGEDDLKRIFERFERVGKTEEVKGLGIGLFIVKEIVGMHGGKINVKSELEKGSEFIVTLPT